MNIYILLAIIPVVLAVALIVALIRRNITENRGGGLDIAPAIPAIVVLMIAILVIVPMAESTQDYLFDEGSGELVIQKNIPQLAVQPWDEYADEVTSLVIKDGVEIGSGVFDSLTSLDYVKVGEDVTLGSNAFGVNLLDPFGSAVQDPVGKEFVGKGDGNVYLCDPAIYTYSSGGNIITGLASGATGAEHLVLPAEHNGVAITTVSTGSQGAFVSNANIEDVFSVPDCKITLFNTQTFFQCTALAYVDVPSVETVSASSFQGDTSLKYVNFPALHTLGASSFRGSGIETVSFPELTSMNHSVFAECTSLTSASIPRITSLLSTVFDGCSALTSIDLSKMTEIGGSCFRNTALTAIDLSSIHEVGNSAFASVSTVTSVKIGSGLTTIQSGSFTSWTFYESDGTTQITKTAENLAGKTFQGTAAALVEVAPGQLNLTPQQLQQVQLHTQESQDLDIQPLPFQPTVQTQDQEPATA